MTSMDIWTYRESEVGDIDLTGFKIQATDGDIGKVDEATYEVGSSYLVVDTGPWIFGKKVLLPAGVVDRIDVENECVFVDRTKDEIKDAPEFDPELHSTDETRRNEIGDYYAAGGRARYEETGTQRF
jgi:hypothetical protein